MIACLVPAAAALIVSALMVASPAVAQPLACQATTLGTTACLGSKLCACIYDRGGVATGIPAGYRWDCGILRPGCGSAGDWPATLNPYTGPYPTAVGIDRSHHNTIVKQTNTNTNAEIHPKTPAAPPPLGRPLRLLPPE